MAILRQTFTIRITRDRVVETLSFAALCGAVICAGVAGGVEAAGAVALLAVRTSPESAAGRYRCLRFDDGTWTMVGAGGALTAVDPPVVHVSLRGLVVLEVFTFGQRELLVFTPSAIPPGDLRRLRVHLRAGGLSR